jgi:uncharacterized protein YndB with AHSA1/START domain
MPEVIRREIIINAREGAVWNALTNPVVLKQWMTEPEMEMDIFTDWTVGSPIVNKGFHHIKFEDRGAVLKFEPNKILEYTYLSSSSRLPDKLENYTHMITVALRFMKLEKRSILSLFIIEM